MGKSKEEKAKDKAKAAEAKKAKAEAAKLKKEADKVAKAEAKVKADEEAKKKADEEAAKKGKKVDEPTKFAAGHKPKKGKMVKVMGFKNSSLIDGNHLAPGVECEITENEYKHLMADKRDIKFCELIK